MYFVFAKVDGRYKYIGASVTIRCAKHLGVVANASKFCVFRITDCSKKKPKAYRLMFTSKGKLLTCT